MQASDHNYVYVHIHIVVAGGSQHVLCKLMNPLTMNTRKVVNCWKQSVVLRFVSLLSVWLYRSLKPDWLFLAK